MNLHKRISLLVRLGEYIKSDENSFNEIKEQAYLYNRWFTTAFTGYAGKVFGEQVLAQDTLEDFANTYAIPDYHQVPKTIGLVMAGNIPMVGLHDMVCIFLSGHRQMIKFSSKDSILMKHLAEKLIAWEPDVAEYILWNDLLKDCDAYIATGSDNSSRYFEAYFSKYPHIIRKNRTSIAILTGHEDDDELAKLADDVHIYFGLGCRNVTQLFVPENYNFEALLNHFRRYNYFKDHEKYRNNFDYQLTIAIMNNRFYMSNDSIVLLENENPFSPISQVHYQFYTNLEDVPGKLDMNKIQCIAGQGFTPFGKVQSPEIGDFPDGIDTMQFLCGL
jgi:hypothetical protein